MSRLQILFFDNFPEPAGCGRFLSAGAFNLNYSMRATRAFGRDISLQSTHRRYSKAETQNLEPRQQNRYLTLPGLKTRGFLRTNFGG